MIFENSPVNTTFLPQVETLQLTKLATAYLRVSMIGSLLFLLFMLAGITAIIYNVPENKIPYFSSIIWGFWGIFALITLGLTYRGYHLQGYALRQKDIVFRKGVLFQSIITIPFNRVQHCEIKQGPIERFFGLKTLEIYTAGGKSSDLSIPGLHPSEAQQFKEYIIGNTVKDSYGEEE